MEMGVCLSLDGRNPNISVCAFDWWFMVSLADILARMTAFDDRQADASAAADRGIVVFQMGAAVHFADRAELKAAFRHRYLLAQYLALTVAMLVLCYLLGLSEQNIGALYPSIMLGGAAVYWVVTAYVGVVLRIAAGRRRVSIRLEPGLMVAAPVAVWVFGIAQAGLGVTDPWAVAETVAYVVLVAAYLMAALVLMLRGGVPRALARMRADRSRGTRLAEARVSVDEAAPAQEPGAAEGDEGDPADQAALSGVLRLEAAGNYVTVVTERGRRLVPGPFAAVVARMPGGAGRRVHRSHWVARRAVVSERWDGRDLRLQMVDGETVPVAVAQVGAVVAWLASGGAQPARKRAEREGQK